MDKSTIKNNNFQDWGKDNINAFQNFLEKNIKVSYSGIWIVGSRVFSAFTEKSDLDIKVITLQRTGEEDIYYQGIRVSLHYRPYLQQNIAYNRFELPYYNLLTREMVQGKDVQKYLDWGKNGYKND